MVVMCLAGPFLVAPVERAVALAGLLMDRVGGTPRWGIPPLLVDRDEGECSLEDGALVGVLVVEVGDDVTGWGWG